MSTAAVLAITPGEPAGIGPELVVALAQQARRRDWRVFADPDLLAQRAALLQLPLQITDTATRASGELWVTPVPLAHTAVAGTLDTRNAAAVHDSLSQATAACLAGDCAALVTGPVQKSVFNDAGIPFSGHTEFLQQRAGVAEVVMLLVAGDFRVALATTHLPLRSVPDAITQELLERRLRIVFAGLRDAFAIARPRVLVAGLNPHAGEGGHLGREEIEIIAPVCERLRDEGLAVVGPLPADTLFLPSQLEQADAAFAMFHDQGLPVLKHAGFGHAVNVTLGLPFVRTSVDHGTALDLAGSGQADSGSMAAALALAEQLIERRLQVGSEQL
ncbi:MAG: 4-hydroxythreonine-4-phosphate dehydrogenase PdxA [Pseudomonadales bacterium]